MISKKKFLLAKLKQGKIIFAVHNDNRARCIKRRNEVT